MTRISHYFILENKLSKISKRIKFRKDGEQNRIFVYSDNEKRAVLRLLAKHNEYQITKISDYGYIDESYPTTVIRFKRLRFVDKRLKFYRDAKKRNETQL